MALVSVIMPVYNGQQFLEASIGSLRSQSHAELEIVVVDDGSTDSSRQLVQDLAAGEPRITLVDQPHGGIAASRNAALAVARGELVTFLDQDDLCPPGTIARQCTHLAHGASVTAVFGLTLATGSAEELADPLAAPRHRLERTMMLSAALFRRSVFDRVGNFDPSYRLADDFDFLLRIMEADLPVTLEDELATVHRRHPDQATADHAATRRECVLALSASLRRRRALGMTGQLRHPLASVAAL